MNTIFENHFDYLQGSHVFQLKNLLTCLQNIISQTIYYVCRYLVSIHIICIVVRRMSIANSSTCLVISNNESNYCNTFKTRENDTIHFDRYFIIIKFLNFNPQYRYTWRIFNNDVPSVNECDLTFANVKFHFFSRHLCATDKKNKYNVYVRNVWCVIIVKKSVTHNIIFSISGRHSARKPTA